MYRILSWLFLLAISCSVSILFGQNGLELPPDFYNEEVGDNWDTPVGLTFDTNGQGYVWEKAGKVYILSSEGEKLTRPLIDISEEIMNWSDLGLVGFALDPNFLTNGYYYLLYVVDRHYMDAFGTAAYDPSRMIDHAATIGRITRYTADPTTGFRTTLPNSRHIILGKDWTDGVAILLGSHAVGSLVFGQDGTLLASFGDGGSYESIDVGNAPATESYWEEAIAKGTLQPEDNVGALKSLQVDNLNGTIVRIDPETGAGLPSNPFYNPDDPFAPRSRVWALGFRNPYRFIHMPNTGSHDPADGDPGVLLVSDVGGAGWEELNVIERGGECFGWPMFEGINFHWGFLNKPAENPYAPNDLDCGGDFFTFHDLIKQPFADQDPPFTHPCDNTRLLPSAIQHFVHKPPTLTWSGLLWNPPPKVRVPGFRADDGRLIEVDLDGGDSPVPGTTAFAGFTGVPGFFYDGSGPLPEAYDGAFFQADLSGWLRTIRFDEAMEVTEVKPFAEWEERGVVHIAYNPHDGGIYWCDVYDSQVYKISYGGNPRPKAIANADRQYGPGPLTVTFSAADSFDPDSTALSYHWEFGDGDTSQLAEPTHTFFANGQAIKSYTVTLTVTDALGASDTETLLISLNNTPPAVQISSIAPNERYPLNGLTYLPLEAEVSDAEHRGEELQYSWQTFLHHNNHYHANAPVREEVSSMVIDPLGCELETYWYRVRLTVTDAEGLSSYDEREIYPNCDNPFFAVTDLQATLDQQEVQLDWTVEFDEGVVYYEVQRSADYTFLAIDQVAASTEFTYSYRDRSPLEGANYYRIKGVDSAGDYHYSNVVFVDATDKSIIKAYPNPVQERLTIEIPEAQTEQVSFEIISPAGYIVYSAIWPATPGATFERTLRLIDLPAGFYFYRVETGNLKKSASFVILR